LNLRFAYSAVHDQNNSNGIINDFQVNFDSFNFKQFADFISNQKYSFDLQIERNLENELSHKSPDWNIYTKFASIIFKLNFEQHKLLRGFLDQNLGEPIKPISSQLNFLIPNTKLETVLSGNVWKSIRIHLDMQNIGIDLVDLDRSIALFKFENTSLIFESYSDTTKLIDLVSNEIAIVSSSDSNAFNMLYKKANSHDSKRLQLELHSRFYKDSDRYSILFNNCAAVVKLDWLIGVKSFFATYVNENDLTNLEKVNKKLELKFNLTNTDFFLVEENPEISGLSQAVILRITAFLEYNQKKNFKPLQSCIQSIQVFSCQTNSIEETALSILDPAVLTINLLSKTSYNINEETENNLQTSTLISNKNTANGVEFLFDISTDTLQMKISYLDIRLFLRIVESFKAQLVRKDSYSWNNFPNKSVVKVEKNEEKWIISDINLVINNFSILIIDDCKDIDIPLFEIIFNRLRIIQSSDRTVGILSVGKGSSEFALNISYYNRLLSGWEPLLEPWLSRFDWKLKETKKSFTLTSMDVLNMNISNPFIDLMLSVFSNWKEDYFKNRHSKHQKVFQPYKLINLSGQTIKFRFFKSDTLAIQGLFLKKFQKNYDNLHLFSVT
jgi:vacuolar protein sorting-associated protein 13D